MSLLTYKPVDGQIEEIAQDYNSNWMTGPQFPCFTGTKVQILTQTLRAGTQFLCFNSTKVQILTQKLAG
jgi:hypothetical protein